MNKFKKGNKYICTASLICFEDKESHSFIRGYMYTCPKDGYLRVDDTNIKLNDKHNDRFYEIKSEQQLNHELQHTVNDDVNHPSHYNWLKELCGIEVIDITRHLDFDCGNAIKYILRAGRKPKNDSDTNCIEGQIQDLKKAIWYLNDKIKLLTSNKY